MHFHSHLVTSTLFLVGAGLAFGQGKQRWPEGLWLGRDVSEQLGTFPQAFDGRVRDLVWSADGEAVFVYDESQLLRVPRDEGLPRRVIWKETSESSLTGIEISPDQTRWARLTNGSGVAIHSLETGKELRTFGDRENFYRAAAWDATGKLIACGGKGGVVVYRVDSGETVVSIDRDDIVESVAFSPDGRLLAGQSRLDGKQRNDEDGSTWIVALEEPESPRILPIGETWKGCAVIFSPNGERVFARCDEKRDRVQTWETATGKEGQTFYHSDSGESLSPDGEILATGGLSQIMLRNVVTGEVLVEELGFGVNERVWSLAFSPDGHHLAAGVESRIEYFQVSPWKRLTPEKGHQTEVLAAAFSPDGQYLYTGDLRGKMICWDWPDRTMRWVYEPPQESWGIRALTLDGSGKTLAISCPDRKNQALRYWLLDAASGKIIRGLENSKYYNDSILFSEDGGSVFTAGNQGGLAGWDTTTGQLVSDGQQQLNESEHEAEVIARIPPSAMLGRRTSWLRENPTWGFQTSRDGTDFLSPRLYRTGRIQAFVSPEGEAFSFGARVFCRQAGEEKEFKFVQAGDRADFFPQGRYSLIPTESGIQLVSLLAFETVREFVVGEGRFENVLFSRDGRSGVIFGEGGVKVLNLKESLATRELERRSNEQLWEALALGNNALALGAAFVWEERVGASEWISERLDPAEAMPAVMEKQLRGALAEVEQGARTTAARLLLDAGLALSEEERKLLNRSKREPSNFDPSRIPALDDWNYERWGPKASLLPLGDRHRSSLAVMVLERVGDAEAVTCLRNLATGAEGHPQTEEARRSLMRLEGEK